MNEHIRELIGLVTKAGQENRAATSEELSRIADLGELLTTKAESDEHKRKPFLSAVTTKADDGRGLITKSQSLRDRFRGTFDDDADQLRLGRMLRGLVTGSWTGAELERKALAAQPAAEGIAVPVPVAAQIIDRARQTSAIVAAGAQTLPMTSATMPIPRIVNDPAIDWYGQNEPIDEVDPVMDTFQLTARKAAVIVRVSNELLEDAPGAEESLMAVLAGAMASELDRMALTGPVANPQLNPVGLLYQTGVHETAAVGDVTDYGAWLQAYYDVIAAGATPTAIIHAVPVARALSALATGLAGDRTPLVPPKEIADLPRYAAPAAGNGGVSFVGDFSRLVVGVRTDVRIELSDKGDGFGTDSTLLRLKWRGDVAPMHPAAFARLVGITV